ncbi:Serine/threonine-protein phosphatase [Podospora fimiseda]|uniref:Serine/threonine-protein phosphatase n=1 Tax=Podospora fimiseda TaxID=252190 RepID=A0AAN7BSP3_9PEZI|nr:Serine/threonine-protein phosphatase [Podospora fimiseda]
MRQSNNSMAPHFSQDGRRARLEQLAAEWGVYTPAPVTPPIPTPARRTPDDDFHAEELLKRHRINSAADKQQSGSIKRAFSSNKKPAWEPSDIFEVLEAHVSNRGAPGVADALVEKLKSVGGNVNVSNMNNGNKRTSLLSRRKSIERLEPSRILQTAIQKKQPEMVAVLVQHAEADIIDHALPLAIRSGDPSILHMLLQRGANATNTRHDAQDAFRQLCIVGGRPDLVGIILQSEGRPRTEWVSLAMVDASRKQCLDTVLRLSRSTADGEFNKAEALKTAIELCRVDIALAILTGAHPPTHAGQGVYESFNKLLEHTTIPPNHKLVLMEALLCAGAAGDFVHAALLQACYTEFDDMIRLLLYYGASIEYQDALPIRHSISNGKINLVHLLLGKNTVLGPVYASECLESIPKNLPPDDRHVLLSMLLRKGAGGPRLSDALIYAVQAGDLNSVKLLLTPQFPGMQSVSSQDLRNGNGNHRGMVYVRHEVASVDHKSGQALSIAVSQGNIAMVKLLLAGKPSTQTLDQTFGQVWTLQPEIRNPLAELFLTAGLSQRCVSHALQQAIEQQPPYKDENLIGILIRYNADNNFNNGAGIISAVTVKDLRLLENLLTSRPASQTLAAALAKAMMENDPQIRFEMVRLLVSAGAGNGGFETSQALMHLLSNRPVDVPLARLLLGLGQANVNFEQGRLVMMAIDDPDPTIFDLIIQSGSPTPDTVSKSLTALSEQPLSSSKPQKVDTILRRCTTRHKKQLNDILFKEVQSLVKAPAKSRQLSIISSLLNSGADINSLKAAAFCSAIKAADQSLVDLMFKFSPTPASLATALPHSLNILDAMNRLTFTQRLIEEGCPADEANRALVYAISAQHSANDLSLIKLLAAHADASNGDALLAAIKQGNPDVVSLVLEPQQYNAAIMEAALKEALTLLNKPFRLKICKSLVQKGPLPPKVLSTALLSAASEADLDLGTLLLDHGAQSDHQSGQAIISACTSGATPILSMLLSKAPPSPRTLDSALQAASQLPSITTRESIFSLLLPHKPSLEVLNEQLVESSKLTPHGEALLSLLLNHGADPNHNSGEAVWNATRSNNMASLQVLLKSPSIKLNKVTLLRALKGSKSLDPSTRHTVLEWFFEAGLEAGEEVNLALIKAVKDEDLRLVKLLLDHGASPSSNGCEAVIDAVQKGLVEVVGMFLVHCTEEKDVSWIFGQSFTADRKEEWATEKGLEVAKMLLARGARGENVGRALGVLLDMDDNEVAGGFIKMILSRGRERVEVDGDVVSKTVRKGDEQLIRGVLGCKPDTMAVSMGFGWLFDENNGMDEDETIMFVKMFTEYEWEGERLDVMFTHPEFRDLPVVFRALRKFPRSAKLLEMLLDAGYYHDQTVRITVPRSDEILGEEVEMEEVSLLFWALLQPQKRVSSTVIEMLIDRGAKVNFETRVTKGTPLMLAIRNRRPDLVKSLILAGAEVDVVDITGNTPMTMATEIGGDLGTSMMSNILAAEPSRNDGSLHNAARELNLPALRVLIEFGHDLDFPSTLHGGRSALGELCLSAANSGPLSAAQEKQLEKVMTFLINQGSDLTIQSDGKSVLLLALHSADPITITKTLLRVGLWRDINQPHNQYTDGVYTYSPTQYVARVLLNSSVRPQLLEILKANRAIDVYYANDGPQPEGAVNLPPELLRAERERRAREERIARETEEHNIALARTKEISSLQNQIFKARAELEASTMRKQRDEELAAIDARRAADRIEFHDQLQRRRAERDQAILHEQRLTEAGLTRARLVSEAELEMEAKKQEKVIGWQRQMSSIRVKERETMDRLEAAADARTVNRINEHKRLVDSQHALAVRVGQGPNGQRVGGYITGEVP